MVRCSFLSRQSLFVFASFALMLFLLPGAPVVRAQNFRSDSSIDGSRTIGTVTVRDLRIPQKAFDDFQRGLSELRKQDSERSIHFFSKAIEKFPAYYEAYYHLGVAQKRLGQVDQAMASFQTAINLSNGKYALAEYGYALLLCKRGKPNDAERTVRYGLELQQDKPIGEVVLGTILLYQHRADEAEKSAREALSLDANTPDAYLVLAGVSGERGNFSQEVENLDSFLNLEPQGSRADQVRGIREVAVGLAERMANHK